MVAYTNDVLVKLETPQITELTEFYSGYKDECPYIYSFLKTSLQWRKTHPEYITIYSVGSDFKPDGTFIAVNTFTSYDIILHSLEESCEKLHRGLTQTKIINWTDNEVFFYALHARFQPMVIQLLNALNVSIDYISTPNLWQISEEDALQVNDTFQNDAFYLDVLKPEAAETINAVWPPRYDNSSKYLRTVIVMNGGYGIYEKSTDKLVAWVLKNILGQIGVLQTHEGYFQKGFARALTRKLAKCIAQNGDHPIGIVNDGNIAPEIVFSTIGFQKKFGCIYIRTYKKKSI